MDMGNDFQAVGRFLSPASCWSPDWLPLVSAWYEHGAFAFWLMGAHRPTVLVELGTHWGFSYYAFCQSARKHGLSTKCHAVDTWQGDEHAGQYGEEVYAALFAYNQQQYPAVSTLHRETFDAAAQGLADGSVDLLHIDGLHTYEAVKHDFETWLPKLSPHAVVLFHDTNVFDRNFGVWRLWQELQAKYPNFEFKHGHGLGVLGVGKDLAPDLQALFAIPPESELAEGVRSVYARLGAGIHTQARLKEAEKLLARPWTERLRSRMLRVIKRA